LQPPGRDRIQLCGRLVIELNGQRVESSLPSRQGRLLFAYLALNPERALPRDELIDCVWPERPPADAAGALNTLLSRLRRAVGPGVIEGKSQIALMLPPDTEIDLRVAAQSLARARAAAADCDWQATWGPAHAALAIARRGLLPGLDAPWIDERRRELEEVELEALELVAETGLGLGGAELPAAERAGKALVDRAPFRESGYRLQMELLAARGNFAEALQVYDDLRRLLVDELGTTPSAALLALHKRLLDGTGRFEPAPAPTTSGHACPLVGRVKEVLLLERALEQTRNRGLGAVLVAGDAGIGKTRLVAELADQAAASGFDVHWGRCHDGQGAPAFWPWIDALRTLTARTSPERLRRAVGTGGADLLPIVPELQDLLPEREESWVLDPETARFRLNDAASRMLQRLAATQPLLVVFDDLHWADQPSLELLRFLAFRASDAPLLVAGAYRDTEVTPALANTLAELARNPRVTRVTLKGLGEADLARIVAGELGRDVGDSLAAAVYERTGGNPFFALELARLLGAEEGPDEAEYLRHQLPGSVRDVIRRRLNRLPAGGAELLGWAAVAGEGCEPGLLAHVSTLDPETRLEVIDAALREQILRESPTRRGRYCFAHAIVRETVYGELGALGRARAHLRVADALEASGRRPDRAIELAHHLFEAAPMGVEIATRAYRAAMHAAEHATAGLAYEQAEAQLRRALELAIETGVDAERAERELATQIQLGALLMMTAGYAAPEVGSMCARAQELCEEVGDELQLLPALWRLGVFHEVRARFDTSRAIGHRLLELAYANGQVEFSAAGNQLIGVAALQQGRLSEARDCLSEARLLADSVTDRPLHETFGQDFRITSRSFLGWALSQVGDGPAGAALLDESLALARRLDQTPDIAFALCLDATGAVLRRETELAARRSDEAQTLCRKRGFKFFGAIAAILNGWASTLAGNDPVVGVKAIETGLAAYTSTGARMMLAFFLGLLAEAYEHAGRPAHARSALENALGELDPGGSFYEGALRRLETSLLAHP
jgi:predicted ATPase